MKVACLLVLLAVAGAKTYPHTCAPGSPSVGLPFCNAGLPASERVQDLLSRLNATTRARMFASPTPLDFDPDLNLKSFFWDITCIHGVAPGEMHPKPNVTVFPHAIALAASFDLDIVTAVSQATAVEARVINALNYNATNGTTYQGVSCDGGPLANTVHDPRWGRVSETYGEDPRLVGTMAAVATAALQNRTQDFLQTSQVTRHFFGFHGASPDLPNGGMETVSPQWWADQYKVAFQPSQTIANAEGIMCSMNSMNGVPACLSTHLLQDVLRTEWNSSAFVQTDCCDSITQVVEQHHYKNMTLQNATVAAMMAGVQAVYGSRDAPEKIVAALTAAVDEGQLTSEVLDAAVSRLLLTRMRLGEFDTENPRNPFRGAVNVSQLDGPTHRLLARRAAASSLVLLENVDNRLPLTTAPSSTIAVIGPFTNCTNRMGGYGISGGCSYLHSYSGTASLVSTLVGAVEEEFAGTRTKVTWAPGCNATTVSDPAFIAQAASVAADADIVVLAVGLGFDVEREGLDRVNLTLPAVQRELVAAVSAVVPPENLVMVIVSAGGVDVDTSIASGVLQAFYPGEETGHAVADVLFGRVSPSGRLPLTVYSQEYVNHVDPVSDFDLISSTGTGRTYRYLRDASLVRYWFGYGLSYATFAYSDLAVLPPSATAPGAVKFTVTNTGGMSPAREVVQAYVTVPTVAGVVTPKYSLAAFSVSQVSVGSPVAVSLVLPLDAILTTLRNGTRVVTPGEYVVAVSGHLPDDTRGVSNVARATFQL